MTGRRPLLGAHVSGPGAAWVLRRVEGAAPDAIRYFQSIGRRDVAASIADAVEELLEANRQWEMQRTDGASAGGNAETSPAEATPESEVPAVGLGTSAAAGLLGVTERRVRQLLDGGLLVGRKSGRQWLVERDSIEAYRTDRRLAG